MDNQLDKNNVGTKLLGKYLCMWNALANVLFVTRLCTQRTHDTIANTFVFSLSFIYKDLSRLIARVNCTHPAGSRID